MESLGKPNRLTSRKDSPRYSPEALEFARSHAAMQKIFPTQNPTLANFLDPRDVFTRRRL